MAGGLAGVHTFTVLFTDLVASTATRARLGEDAFDLLRAEHDDLTIATIEALNGTMVKHTGDGAMALFVGAGDALACATRLQQILERRNRAAAEKIEIRAGLSMGDVVIEADDVQGIAVVEARRLCDAAEGGQVLCSDLVRAASGTRGGHRFGPVTERELKGLGAPLASCELVWAEGTAIGEPPRFRVFGPLAVERDGTDLPLGGQKERAVLATLVASEGATVSTDALAEAVWGDAPPRSARRTVQAYVARLRGTIGATPAGRSWLTTHGSAYLLEVDRANVDALQFTDLAAGARALLERGDPGAAVTAFEDALALWRAKPYDGFEDIESCAAAARSLEELRRNVIEDRFDALLALGQSSELVPELEGVLTSEPFRERLWGQLMVALYRSGRQTDALRAYQRARRVLADELGVDPGPALRDLERAILDHDDSRLRRSTGGEPIVALPAALDVAGAALVGRDEELARLRVAWDSARSNTTGFVSVVGPEGIGKTRLVSALAAEAHAGGAVICYARCDAAHRSARALFDQALRSAGTSLLHAQSRAVPGESLGVGIARSLADWSTRTPILVVLDDLHEAVDEVLEVVAEIPSAAAGAALLVVAVFRTEPDDTAMRAGGGQQIMLGGIDRAAVTELCALYGDAWTTAEIDRLHAETFGIPLAVHEEAAALARDASSRRLDDAADRAKHAEHRLLQSQQAVADEVVGIQRLVEQRRKQLPTLEGSPRPFMGLLAFGLEDAPWFFGRERLVAELAARLATRPVLAVVGASGSGKSSLVRAGLLPALAAGSLPGSEHWRVVVTAPGATPTADLERSLEAVAAGGPRVLVVVDQLEELFTHCDDIAEREEFGQALQRLVDHGAAIVATLRADQMGPLSEVPSLARLLRGNDVLISPIRERELRDVIERPAHRAGLQLEQGLVELILADAQGSSGVLPLLQTALLATWERRTGNVLTLGAYQESGGVQGAVARLAETTFADLAPSEQEAARRILMRLAEASDDGTLDLRRRVRVDDIAGRDDADARVAYEEMVRHRLLISTEDTVEVSHEALLREWPRLREWLHDDVEGRRLHQRLGDSAVAWAAGDRDESELLRGSRLSAALDWAVTHPHDLNHVEREFLEASRELAGREVAEANERADREARTSKRLRRLLVGMAVLLVVALATGALAVVQRDRADDAASTANAERDQARVNRLVAESDRELDSHLDLALLLAVEARRRDDTPATRGALLTALTHNITSERLRPGAGPITGGQIHTTNSSFLGFLSGPPRLQFDVDVSDDGRTVASAGPDETGDGGLVLIFDTGSHEELGRVTDDTAILGVDVNRDGREVLARGDAELFLFDADTATTTTLPIEPPAGDTFDLALFEPGTDRVLVVMGNGAMQLWDRSTSSPADVALPPGPVTVAGFRPDGTLVVDQPNATVLFWDLGAGRPIRSVQLQEAGGPIGRATLTSNEARIVAHEQPLGRVFVWDTTTGSLVGDPAVRPGTVRSLATSPTAAATVAIGSAGGGISFYDLNTERVIGEPVYGHGAGLRDLAYSASGDVLVSVADDGLIGLWGRNDAPGLISRPVANDAISPSPSDDGSRVLVLPVLPGPPEVRAGDAPTTPGVKVTTPDGARWGMLSDDGALVLAGNEEALTLSVSDAQTGKPLWTKTDEDFPSGPTDIDDSGLVVAWDVDTQARLRVWDTTTGRRVADASASDLPGVSDDEWFTGWPRFTDDGSFIDIPGAFGVGRFRAEDLEPVAFVPLGFVAQDLESIPGTDDVVAVGVSGRLVRVNMATGEVEAEGRSADPSSLGYVELSPDGTVVVVYHPFSYQLALFDTATLRPIGEPFPVGDYIFEPHFTPDGRAVIGNGLFHGWSEWDVDPDAWQEQACLAAGRNLTEAEWDEYLGPDEPYRATCDRWTVAEG